MEEKVYKADEELIQVLFIGDLEKLQTKKKQVKENLNLRRILGKLYSLIMPILQL